jgi:hypothetical protein
MKPSAAAWPFCNGFEGLNEAARARLSRSPDFTSSDVRVKVQCLGLPLFAFELRGAPRLGPS